MMISIPQKLLFIAIPKTGTRSIYDCMQHHFNGVEIASHGRDIPDRYKSYYTFCTVRNPYHRAVSIWWSTCKRNNDKRGFIRTYLKEDNSFLNFCRHIRAINENERLNVTLPQAYWLSYINLHYIMQFESLEAEWLSMPFNQQMFHLDHLNPTTAITRGNPVTRDDYDQYLCKESIQLVNEYYSDDFKLTGHKMIQP